MALRFIRRIIFGREAGYKSTALLQTFVGVQVVSLVYESLALGQSLIDENAACNNRVFTSSRNGELHIWDLGKGSAKIGNVSN